ncbi:hypothetical protein ACA086_08135 [Muriicola sp. E247]|uniref:hypothetical protein n=1 Tax=Muriicola sp. E247 TaxID=3242730 RepID=UPI0035238357
MTTFFTIFFVLILVNAALLAFSLFTNKRNQTEIQGGKTQANEEIIYPLDWTSSEYRKAI